MATLGAGLALIAVRRRRR
ncbi:MAG: hypothetical protein JST11_08450 [Acidobacteria bacterium]|nr:hypothetical protein [Acidobacteriota bacterium]